MDELQKPSPRISSRTLAIVVVALLIAVAIAGIMMALMRGRSEAPGTVSTASPSPSASAASAPKATPTDLTHILFAANSDQLSPLAVDQIKGMAESTKGATSAVVLSGKIESTSDRAARMDLAKKRINAVRRALQADGIAPGRFRVEIAEYPVGRVPPREVDMVEMNLR